MVCVVPLAACMVLLCAPLQEAEAPDPAELRVSADQGDAAAQFELGRCYYFGEGVDEDNEQALYWFQKAADQGHGEAQYFLGRCHFHGHGTAENDAEALRWFREAAAQDVVGAWYHIGLCHLGGYGVEMDEEEGVRWVQRAADAGSSVAMYELGMCHERGRGVAESPADAFAWYERGAQAGSLPALRAMAFCYRNGYGVEADPDRSVQCFREAAGQGDDESRAHLRRWHPGEHLDVVDGAFDLRVFAEVNRPVLVSRKETAMGIVEIELPGGETRSESIASEADLLVVDDYQKFAEDGGFEATRHFVRSFRTLDGRPADDELNGTTLQFYLRDGQNGLDVLGERVLSQDMLESQLKQYDSVGLVCYLPAEARPGETIEANLAPIWPFLVAPEAAPPELFLTFVGHDLETNRATLSGTFEGEMAEKTSFAGPAELRISGRIKGRIELQVNLQTRLVHDVEVIAVVTGAGSLGGLPIAVRSTLEVECAVQIGPEVEGAQQQEPQMRLIPRLLVTGLEGDLPSYWADSSSSDEERFFINTLDHSDDTARVACRAFPCGALSMRDAIEVGEKEILGQYPDALVKRHRSALGEGSEIRFETEGRQVEIQLLPLGEDRILRLRLLGSPAGVNRSRSDFENLLQSLEFEAPGNPAAAR